MYAILVLKHGLNPEYVLDKMSMCEINALMKYAHYTHQDEWEQARLNAYMTAQVNSKKRLKVEDIIKFPWEDEKEKHNTEITREDIERLKIKAKNYIEQHG